MPSTIIVRRFVLVWFVLLCIGLAAVMTQGKLPMHAAMNAWDSSFLDQLAIVLTFLADGWVPTALALLFLLVSDLRSFLMMGLSCILSSIIVQTLKRNVFDDMDRPSMFRDALGDMHWVDGIEQFEYYSFPSGHSTAAFSMCLALAVILNRKQLAIPLTLAAAAMAWSRIHLSQHFLQDTLAGSTVGTLTAVAVYYWLFRSQFARKAWLQRRLVRRKSVA